MEFSPVPSDRIGYYGFLDWTFYKAIHLGQDYWGRDGDLLKAPCDGEVLGIVEGKQGGVTVIFLADDNSIHRLMHCNQKTWGINTGRYQHGSVIGYMGTTGLSTGVHLHWDIQPCNKEIKELQDALDYTNESLAIIAKSKTKATVKSRFKDPLDWMGEYSKKEETAPEWSLDAIEFVQDKGLMGVDNKGNAVDFRANDNITRAEIAVVVERLYNQLSNE